MESKIEKFVGDDSCTPRDFDTYRYINNLQDKVNEIIDHLNSQAQAEVLPVEGDEFEYNGEKYKWGKTYTSKDTPEEKEGWEKRFIRTFGYWGEEIKFIKQLLDEREREVLEDIKEDIKGVNNEIYEGRTEKLEVEIDNRLYKLRQ